MLNEVYRCSFNDALHFWIMSRFLRPSHYFLLVVDHIYNRDGDVSALTAGAGFGTKIRHIGIAFEDVDITLAAVENDLLFQYSNAVKLLASAAANTRFKIKLDIKADIDRIEPAVKLHGVNMDGRPANRGSLYSNIPGTFQNFIAEIGQEHPDILEAVTIAAAVQNAVGLDANRFTPAPGRSGAGKFVFCHGRILLDHF